MAYLFYTISFALLVIATGLYMTRARWLPHIEPLLPDYVYERLPTALTGAGAGGASSFASDMEAGFSSSAFDLAASNLATGDARGGLDPRAKREVQRIMRARRVGFDEARRIYTEQRFAKNGIRPDGLPVDPKFVSFS